MNTTEDDAFSAIAKQSEATAKLQEPFDICVDDSGSGYLSKALLSGNIELAVELCLEQNRMADAIILALQGGPLLIQHVQDKYFEKCGSKELPLIRAVVNNDWNHVVNFVTISHSWKEALVATLTYAEHDQFSYLCSKLGYRLLEANMKEEALLCFICARNLDQVVSCWMETRKIDNTNALQDLVEIVMALKSAYERMSGQALEINSGPLSTQLTKYANVLAAQGALSAALTYLGDSNEESINNLRERLQGALGSQRKISTSSSTAPAKTRLGARSSWNSGDQNSYYNTGIHNPAAESFQPPPVPHLDQGGISNRRGSRPAPPQVDSFGSRRTSTENRMYAPPSSMMNPVAAPVAPNVNPYFTPAPVGPAANMAPTPNIFTPDFSHAYGQGSVPPPPSAAVAPPPKVAGKL